MVRKPRFFILTSERASRNKYPAVVSIEVIRSRLTMSDYSHEMYWSWPVERSERQRTVGIPGGCVDLCGARQSAHRCLHGVRRTTCSLSKVLDEPNRTSRIPATAAVTFVRLTSSLACIPMVCAMTMARLRPCSVGNISSAGRFPVAMFSHWGTGAHGAITC